MNLIILEDHHFLDGTTVRLGEPHRSHIAQVLRCQPGDRVTVGRLNDGMGEARITTLSDQAVEMTVCALDQPAPPPLPLTLVLGLPRPRMLQRSLQTIATMGVERLCLIQTNRVEKSYWQTPLLKPDSVHQQLILGLEQAKATQLPKVTFHQRFRPFVEDELPALCEQKSCLVAHPGDYERCPNQPSTPTVLAVGPEGGFVPHEIERLEGVGFEPVQLGERILRVETAIPVLISRLFY
jgi:RsmE family RNA methyltransferase